MKIYDISQEVFSCNVYPGDPKPEKQEICRITRGDLYNLTAFSMCAHNGTHVDAPFHFVENGRTVDRLDLNSVIGWTYVVSHRGVISKNDAADIVNRANTIHHEAAKRIILKGECTVSEQAADVFAEAKTLLLGTESQSVGPENAPMAVHKILLASNTVLLEGLDLHQVSDGVYFLSAAPLCLEGADGAPCRAVLVDLC